MPQRLLITDCIIKKDMGNYLIVLQIYTDTDCGVLFIMKKHISKIFKNYKFRFNTIKEIEYYNVDKYDWNILKNRICWIETIKGVGYRFSPKVK